MKKLLIIAFLGLFQLAFSQDRGTIKGTVTDKEMASEPLPFANVFIKGTSIGSTTDMDGNYTMSAPSGNQTIVFSFVGYKTVEKTVLVKAGETVTVNQELGADQGVALEEVKINATVSKEKESALLLEQKKATVIKESIGAVELSKKGVSDAAAATTKISGVTKSEGTGDIFIRGLGDRYLSTTMNGLPVPSDDVSNKNINLSLFSTNIIKNVGITKTYSVGNYADQASGNVDVQTKDYSKDFFTIGLSGGGNSNVFNLSDNFRRTVISNDQTFGFHKKKYALIDAIKLQGWDTEKSGKKPINFGISLSGGKKFQIGDKDFRVVASVAHSKSYEYRKGLFKRYRSNILYENFKNTETYKTNYNTTGYLRLSSKINDKNKLKYNTLFVSKSSDNLYEQGRDRTGYLFDVEPREYGAFVRDQNFKETQLIINQILGDHMLNDNLKMLWGAGYNYVLAEEPNRIRNEIVLEDYESSDNNKVEFYNIGDFQQRKSSQKINDNELNGFIENQWKFGSTEDEYEEKPYTLDLGVNFRKKDRDFKSLFMGIRRDNTDKLLAPSFDQLSIMLNDVSFFDSERIQIREANPDLYKGKLLNFAAYANFNFKLSEKFSGTAGARFEKDNMDVNWDVANYRSPDGVSRIGSVEKKYTGIYPSINLKYQLIDNHFLRFASSITQTLPEFKEISPFEYVRPTGRVIKGNPDLNKSDIYNVDLKWEFFPSREQLISTSLFYKQIKDPINLAQTRGSSGYYAFFNTGSKADVYGVEIEARVDLVKNEDEKSLLSFSGNFTKMWLTQDLLEDFQYKGKITSGLQGASDLIFNGSLSYNSRSENPFIATLVGNYSSDKIFALGNPDDKSESKTLYTDEVIEKGFFTLDAILNKKYKDFNFKLSLKNLLNPNIEQSQTIRNLNTKIETNETVLQYKKGVRLSLGVSYNF